jgi:hypothetical protein
MKTTIMHLMSLFLILAFSASCGKKSDSSGSKSNNVNNPVTNGSVVGTAAQAELEAWLNAAETNSGMRAYYLKKSGSMNGWIEREICRPVGGGGVNLPGCMELTSCFVSNGIALGLGTTVFDDLRAKDCTLSGAFHTKSSDATLREAILGKTSGRVILKDRTVKNGNLYTVYFAQYAGSTTVSGAAQINTSLPSVLNPTVLEEGNQRTKTFYLPY